MSGENRGETHSSGKKSGLCTPSLIPSCLLEAVTLLRRQSIRPVKQSSKPAQFPESILLGRQGSTLAVQPCCPHFVSHSSLTLAPPFFVFVQLFQPRLVL